ncbi:putative FBD domain-containing protein [Medicago truncatula]|uniref:Putative FBD domain-containing protein n=1 Tax=Medicago truncatula TaxID=3880 RepID=A0A396HLB2_MEDTR|nr:putative FBD domain-containing protein [Medicago truncatula]
MRSCYSAEKNRVCWRCVMRHEMLWYFYGVIIALVYGPFCPLIEVKNSSWFVDAHCVFVFAPLLQIISIQHEVDVRLKHLRSFIIFNNSLCLNEFSYCGNHVPQTIILPFTCDASAKIILHEGRNHMSPFEPFHLLKQFSHARSIKFEVSKVLMQPKELCVFPMLTDLEVGLVSVEILLALLQKTPVLKTLVLKGIRTFEEELLNSSVVPECLASLHVVKFEEVNGDDHELILAQFLVENGMVLERMCFSLVSQIPDKDEVMEEFKEKMSSFHNFIPDVVEFSYE